ncbi:MAG: cell envelope integrity protein CreD [Gracilimonas sp.]|uniref:cell envelope integrity protein CreD n=1 Tax=Gracilimonas TaxID=649462 RepID=UPI001B10C858|nr:cell envelope integrity protein CreD [Gracilimonas sp.]MBO6587357.1 cell envelope integrity protein CreD [Gracilimonas sp.]MBO6614157.1 cell envelope integrity protein CreD [Gracilimonas sp.]
MKNLRKSLGTRLFIIAFLTLILLIPSLLIQGLISEREYRRDSVADEISQKWGDEQVVVGPIISVPYRYYFNGEDKVEQTIRYAHFLPENLNVEGAITPEIRYRGIYKVIVYNSSLSVSGNFPAIDLSGFKVPVEDFLIEDAFVSVGISDMTGIKDFVNIKWNESEFLANPGIESNDVLASGISIAPDLTTGEAYDFSFDLNLNGSTGLHFSPVGKQTNVALKSDWSNPSFTGNFLPAEREVTDAGFDSEWNVLHLNRNFAQQWQGPNQEVTNTLFGVELLLAVDEYQKTMRTAKYAIMFISLTFLTFFMIELLSKKIIHPIQYLLIGFALLIFYTLLLSISEYVVFQLAYIIAAAAIIGLITIYSYSVLSDKLKSGIIFGVLIILYGYLYILLQLQDYALLLGSLGLFVVLSVVMYLTRNINWFEIMSTEDEPTA